jgi:hypothetical protein
MTFRTKLLTIGLSLAFAGTAFADTVVLNFEGINTPYPTENYAFINNFYNGGTSSVGTSGTNYGISFSSNAQAICLNTPGNLCSNTSRGGQGDPSSQEGGLFFLSGDQTFLDDAAGFTTGFSLFYTAIGVPGSLSVYSGLDGTGTLLATLDLPITPSDCDPSYEAGFCPFVPIGVAFSGTAESISFAGVENQIVFDDVTFGSVNPGNPGTTPEPSSLAMLLTAAGAGAGFLRRKLQASRS